MQVHRAGVSLNKISAFVHGLSLKDSLMTDGLHGKGGPPDSLAGLGTDGINH